MSQTRLFDTDTFLELAPRWGDSFSPLAWGPWLLVGLVPAGLIVWLYRYEIRLGQLFRLALQLRVAEGGFEQPQSGKPVRVFGQHRTFDFLGEACL